MEDEYHLFIACSVSYKVIHEKYDDLLDEHDNVSVLLNFHQEGHIHMCMHYFDIESFYYRVVILFLGRSHIEDDMLSWSHRSKLTSSWTVKYLF